MSNDIDDAGVGNRAVSTAHDDRRRARVRAHRHRGARPAALALATVTLRLGLPARGAAGVPVAPAYPCIAWACSVPQRLAVELGLRRPAAAAAPSAAVA